MPSINYISPYKLGNNCLHKEIHAWGSNYHKPHPCLTTSIVVSFSVCHSFNSVTGYIEMVYTV